MNKLKKRKAKFGLDEYEYVGKEKGIRYVVRYILNNYTAKVEIKDENKILAVLWIHKDLTRVDAEVRHNDEAIANCIARLFEKEVSEYGTVSKTYETQADCWRLMEKVVNYAKESESLC